MESRNISAHALKFCLKLGRAISGGNIAHIYRCVS